MELDTSSLTSTLVVSTHSVKALAGGGAGLHECCISPTPKTPKTPPQTIVRGSSKNQPVQEVWEGNVDSRQ